MEQGTLRIRDGAFKDAAPQKTVERIKKILAGVGIETEERWNESGVPYCYSMRVDVSGTIFGANGKGITREFALASAYGELMERLQLGFIFREDQQKDSNVTVDCVLSERIPAKDLLERNRNWYTLLVRELRHYTGAELTEEALLEQCADSDGYVSATPYYSVFSRTREYLPTELRKTVYVSNGCAAGNTMEEALVQAISEIVERRYKLRILSENIALPEIPEEVLQACPIAWDIIGFLRENGFRVVVKDGSLGTKFPVVCVCLIDRNTGRYHTHFGAAPNFEIALERTLTESFQGRTLKGIAKYEDFDQTEAGAFALKTYMHELVKGTSEKRAEFFLNTARNEFNREVGFAGKNNRELLRECIEFFAGQGYDVLVRDCSCLGFPTCQVVIPGYSEVFVHRLSRGHDDMRYRAFAPKVLADPTAATVPDRMGFLMHLAHVSGPVSFLNMANIAARTSLSEESYLLSAALAHVNYALGRYAETVKYVNKMLAENVETDKEYLVCLKRYLSLTKQKYDGGAIREILACFHRPETIRQLYACLEERKNPLDAFVLRCDLQCRPDCLLYASCRKKRTDQIVQLINTKMGELDGSALRAQLEEITTEAPA